MTNKGKKRKHKYSIIGSNTTNTGKYNRGRQDSIISSNYDDDKGVLSNFTSQNRLSMNKSQNSGFNKSLHQSHPSEQNYPISDEKEKKV